MSHPTRFFIALIPPQDIQDYANAVIRELGDRYQMHTAKAPPHVTLQPPFLWEPGRLEELTHCLEQFVRDRPILPVFLSGFSAFAPRVLYINVLKTEALLQIQTALMETLETTLGIVDPKSKQRPFSPHMTVASRNVTRQSFKQAWADLQSRAVEWQWAGDRLTLLRHDGHRWQIHSEHPLQ